VVTDAPLLELTKVNTFYDRSHVLYDVALEVDPESMVALIGRNGAGKSTTLKSIIGLVPPESGSVTFREQDITELSPHETAGLGISYVPETRRVFPHLTVEENITMGYLGHDSGSDAHERVYNYFPRLEERAGQHAGQLSGGEQQMLAIGRALVSNPELMLIDEPTEGLMPSMVETIRNVLQRINDGGTSVLLVEQNVELALEISEYAYVIDEGVIQTHRESERIKTDEEIKQRYLSV